MIAPGIVAILTAALRFAVPAGPCELSKDGVRMVPFADETRAALARSRTVAFAARANAISSAYITLGILNDKNAATDGLRFEHVDVARLTGRLRAILPREGSRAYGPDLPYDSVGTAVLCEAIRHANQHSGPEVTALDLLAGLIEGGSGNVVAALKSEGVDSSGVERLSARYQNVLGGPHTTFRRAAIDSTGELRIALSTGGLLRPARDSEQVGFEQPAIAKDGRTVGWLARYPNCCTSYPIPLTLVLLRAGGGRTVIGNALPIWQWAFAADARRVVIRQAPVHGDAPEHYELLDIRTGRVIATAERDAANSATLPRWAEAVKAKR